MLSFVNIFQLTTIRFCVILVSSETHFTISNEKPLIITLKKEDIMQGSFTSAENLKERLVITTVADTY